MALKSDPYLVRGFRYCWFIYIASWKKGSTLTLITHKLAC